MTDIEIVESDFESSYCERMFQQSVQIDNRDSPSADVNSSILEFLDLERKCLNSGGGDSSEVDIKTIIEEINRLSCESPLSGTACDEASDRSIEDIINEAERLVNEASGVFNVSKPTVSKNFSKTKLKIHSKVINNNQTFEEKCSENCNKANEYENDTKTSLDKSVSYDEDSFDTVSDVKSLPEDDNENKINDQIEENGVTTGKTFVYKLSESPVFLRENICRDEEIVNQQIASGVEEQVEGFEDSISMRKKYKRNSSSGFCDASTSPTRLNGESDPPEYNILNFKKTEDHVRDLEERLKAAKIQHNSVASSFRSLTHEHAALETKTFGLQAEVSRLQEMLKATNLQLEKQRDLTDQLRNANMRLQKQIENERATKKMSLTTDEEQKKTIQDLQRQIREMDRILSKKYPDSVSALIVASKTPTVEANESARRLLEDRIEQLEASSRTQTAQSQTLLQSVQDKFNTMQMKYEAHISDLEAQVFHLQQINAEFQQKEKQLQSSKLTREQDCQTDTMITKPQQLTARIKKNSNTVGVQTNKVILRQQLVKSTKQVIANAANKEETHLLTTIRGLKQDLAAKEKAFNKIVRELDDCKKTIKRFQREREANLKMQSQNKAKEYDPQSFTESEKQEQVAIQNRALHMLQQEYQSLVQKRLQDLATLQNTHERQLTSLDQTIHTLHNRIQEKDSTIASLKGQIKNKVSALEKRQIERDQTLQSLVSKLSNGKQDKDWINM